MALIKTDGQIVDIRGRVGGDVFKRDSSGLHVTKLAGTVKKPPTDEQKKQRNWYTHKKYQESRHGWPIEPYDVPDTPNTALIYSLEWISAHRQPSLAPPTEKQVEFAGFWPDQIWNWVLNNYNPAWAIWGMSKDLMFLLTLKWFHALAYTKGFPLAVAFAGAKTNFMAFISAQASAVAAPAFGFWLGLIGMDMYFSFLVWLEGVKGFVTFTKGRVLIRTQYNLSWGNLVARPSTKMFDFYACASLACKSWQWYIIPDRQTYQLHFLFFNELWQTAAQKLLWWYVYSWQQARCRWRGYAYKADTDLFRMQCSEGQRQYWDVPVGYTLGVGTACSYLFNFHDYFQAQGESGPDL